MDDNISRGSLQDPPISFKAQEHIAKSQEHKLYAYKAFINISKKEYIGCMSEDQYCRRRDCGSWVAVNNYHDKEDRQIAEAAAVHNQCRQRLCPMCEYIGARRRAREAMIEAAALAQAQPGSTYVHLTLTVRNCTGTQLDDTIGHLLEAWRLWWRQAQRQAEAVQGYYRAIEVSYNKAAASYHPHLHVLLHLRDDYGKPTGGYLSVDWIRKTWGDLLRRIHDSSHPTPQVRIERVTPKEGSIINAIREVSKYPAKPQDIYQPGIFSKVYMALHSRRIHAYGGTWAAARKEAQQTDNRAEALRQAAYFWAYRWAWIPAQEKYTYYDAIRQEMYCNDGEDVLM